MVSALVTLYEPAILASKNEFKEDEITGLPNFVQRWADVNKIWGDFDMSVKLIKYLKVHEVDENLWIEDYSLAWNDYPIAEKPESHVTWSKTDKL